MDDDMDDDMEGEVRELVPAERRREEAVRRRGLAEVSGNMLLLSCRSAMVCRMPSKRAVRLPIELFGSVAAGKSKLPDMVDRGTGWLRDEGLVIDRGPEERCGGERGRVVAAWYVVCGAQSGCDYGGSVCLQQRPIGGCPAAFVGDWRRCLVGLQ
jgi:hypothetical protein